MLQIQQTAPGRWLAVSVPGRLVVVECQTPSGALAEALWTAVADAEDLQPVLDHLTRNGLLATPAFAVAEWDDQAHRGPARFIVRGSARIVVVTPTGERQVSASGVSTWLEQVIDDAVSFRVDLGTAPTSDDILLPFSAGAAWVTGVRTSETISAPRALPTSPNNSAIVPVGTPESAEPDPIEPDPIESEPSQSPTSVEATPPGDESVDDDAIDADPGDATAIAEATVVESFESAADPVDNAEIGYDHLFGATMMRSVEDAAVRADENDDDGSPAIGATPAQIVPPDAGTPATAVMPVAEAEPVEQELGDHDGLTVFSGDIHKLRRERTGAAADDTPTTALPAASPSFVLQITGGATEPLNDTVLVGRAPSVSKVSGGSIPRLVTVGSADQDISRNHVQFAVEGDTVVVTDLHSRNGTLIVLPGKSPQKLRQGEPTSVIVGTLVDLGGGVTMTVGHA